MRDLAEIAAASVGDCAVEYAGTGDPDARSYRVDFGKFARAFPDAGLAWNATAGADELRDAYRDAGLTLEEFESDRFTRLKRIRALRADERLDAKLRWRDEAVVALDA